jgi:hypothetical protein
MNQFNTCDREFTPQEVLDLINAEGEDGAIWYVVLPSEVLCSQHTPSPYPPPFDDPSYVKVVVNGVMAAMPRFKCVQTGEVYTVAVFIVVGKGELVVEEENSRSRPGAPADEAGPDSEEEPA